MSSPRAWGCFYEEARIHRISWVFPTCVGVFPLEVSIGVNQGGLPHVRGGVSIDDYVNTAPGLSSPRAWGCFSLPRPAGTLKLVFPTCVGVFLRTRTISCPRWCLPHVRGGVSTPASATLEGKASSPRAWGCFYALLLEKTGRPVFPTCVGVFLKFIELFKECSCLPHVRGGVSEVRFQDGGRWASSPRAWGCF